MKQNVNIIYLTLKKQGVVAKPPKLRDWARELDILGAFMTALYVEDCLVILLFPIQEITVFLASV